MGWSFLDKHFIPLFVPINLGLGGTSALIIRFLGIMTNMLYNPYLRRKLLNRL